MLHGIWAQAPYLHNGSVPTLGQLLCQSTRPARFLRGNLRYDEALVGFEWADRPGTRYAPGESMLIKEYDTACPAAPIPATPSAPTCVSDTKGLDRSPIARRSSAASRSRASATCCAYLKTL